MIRLRYALIAAYIAAISVAIVLELFGPGPVWLTTTLFVIGFGCLAGHTALQQVDKGRERASRREWESQVRTIADDLSLEGYGIHSVEELANFHDAAGREAILTALKALPVGRRLLRTAASQVDPDAAWD